MFLTKRNHVDFYITFHTCNYLFCFQIKIRCRNLLGVVISTNAIEGISTKETKFIDQELPIQTWLLA